MVIGLKSQDTYYCDMETPIGRIRIEENGEAIISLHNYVEKESNKIHCETKLLLEAKKQLNEYFAGTRREFDLPICLHGTEFQKKVWNVLCSIPYGETLNYGGVAAKIGNPKAARAVGGANNKNPIMIIVPCHRVIGANGSLVGFGGGLPAKEYLLSLEKRVINNKNTL